MGARLGRFVTLRRRVDGTARVFFQVPTHLRPAGWPSVIRLPRDGATSGNLSDIVEVDRIRTDAYALYRELRRAWLTEKRRP